MLQKFGQHFDAIKWSAEFIMLPLHWLAVAHMYSVATSIGSVVLLTYMAASIHHARMNGIHHHASVPVDKE
jgi:hypothetical protein